MKKNNKKLVTQITKGLEKIAKLSKPKRPPLAGTFEVYKIRGNSGQWKYRYKGGNGEKMTPSESYPTKSNAVRGARDLFDSIRAIAEFGVKVI